MPNSTVSQIQLPNGITYDIEDTTARQMQLNATYTAATFDLALDFTSVADSDNEEFQRKLKWHKKF